MTDSRGINDMSNQSDCSESYNSYLSRAVAAFEAGDLVLAMHLYLAAYEKAVTDPDIPDGMAIAGLQEAWNLACKLKERSMAEYVFEKLEPFLTGEEIAACAAKLQSLALDRLEEYGFSREELEGMAEMITQDFAGGDTSVVKVESISLPHVTVQALIGTEGDGAAPEEGFDEQPFGASAPDGDADDALAAGSFAPAGADADMADESNKGARSKEIGMSMAPADFNPYDEFNTSSVGKSYHAATNDGSGSYVFTRDVDRANESEAARAHVSQAAEDETAQLDEAVHEAPAPAAVRKAVSASDAAGGKPAVPARSLVAPQQVAPAKNDGQIPSLPEIEQGPYALNYRQLVGYDDAMALMRDFGIGLQRDEGFRNFVSMMNSRHGLDRMPTIDSLLFRAPVIEDATRFVDATLGEIGLPVLRMSMEEGFQGTPVLCVTTVGDSRPRMNHAHNRFAGPGVLVLDDLDTWAMPQVPEGAEGIAGFVMANVSRGAREAINLIRSAVEDPDVYVVATATMQGDVDPFFYEVLEPITIIDIGLPTSGERGDIWAGIMSEHPSMSELDRDVLVSLSAGLPRYDLYMCARAAVEEAYKTGLVQRMYQPVTMQNILDKLAACQPLESDEYRAIEEEILREFREGLGDLENLVDGLSE